MLASLVYGIRERRGFIVVSGEVGTGKTTLINAALDRLDEKTKVAYICNTAITFDQLLEVSLMELGLNEPTVTLSKVQAIHRLNEFTIEQLTNGGNVVLIVDEAQNLDELSLENLRLLSNLETRKHKLIQIILSGQPELDLKLNRPELRQLTQRISIRRCIRPLSEEETYAYIEHRLAVGGAKDSRLFGAKAKRMIYEFSAGFPRKINVLCDNALLIAFGLNSKKVDAKILEEAASDLGWRIEANHRQPILTPLPSPPLRDQGRLRRVALAATIAFALGIFLSRFTPFATDGTALSPWRSSIPERVLDSKAPPVGTHGQAANGLPSAPQAQATSLQTGMKLTAESTDLSSPGAVEPKHTFSKAVGQSKEREAEGVLSYTPGKEEPVSPSRKLPLTDSFGAKPFTPTEPSPNRVEDRIVQKGETLSEIIVRTYGEFDLTTLSAVMKENPHIRSADFIYPGQVIRLPRLNDPTS